MANPDFSLISELMLKSYGFKEVRVLSKKIASMVDLCDGLLSSQAHYEFGLRSIISILRAAGELKKSRQDEDSSIWQIYVKSTPSYHDCHIALNTSQSPRVFFPNHNQQKCTKDFIQVHYY